MFGKWKKIAPGYGKMVLGYFGKTPVEPDSKVIELASKKLKLEPTKENPLDIADADHKKSISVWKERLEIEGIETTEENIFIAAACDEKGIAFLKGESPLNIRKLSDEDKEKDNNNNSGETKMASGNYTVVVDGQKFSVQVAEGSADIQITPSTETAPQTQSAPAPASSAGSTEVPSTVAGSVWKILKKVGEDVQEGEVVMILEAMKMEIEIESPCSGKISSINVGLNDTVEEGQVLATI
jgi:pyruvate carboxylase subunit B